MPFEQQKSEVEGGGGKVEKNKFALPDASAWLSLSKKNGNELLGIYMREPGKDWDTPIDLSYLKGKEGKYNVNAGTIVAVTEEGVFITDANAVDPAQLEAAGFQREAGMGVPLSNVDMGKDFGGNAGDREKLAHIRRLGENRAQVRAEQTAQEAALEEKDTAAAAALADQIKNGHFDNQTP